MPAAVCLPGLCQQAAAVLAAALPLLPQLIHKPLQLQVPLFCRISAIGEHIDGGRIAAGKCRFHAMFPATYKIHF